MIRPVLGRLHLLTAFLISLTALTGCRTVPNAKPIDISEPGWRVRQGQALWRNKADAPEIAGEVILATNVNERAFVQFLKNPLPLLTGEVAPGRWRIEFIPEKRSFAGRGKPPRRLLWLQLLANLQQPQAKPPLSFAKMPDNSYQIEDHSTGERVTLFLNEE
jgi:hypothetical protein